MAIFIVRAIYGSDNFTYTATPYCTDVTPATFGFKWIQKLKDLGITAGCTVTTYCPTAVAARDQMAVFIIRARLDGITSGCTVTSYCPIDAVTRGQMAAFIMRGAFNQFLPAGTPVISQISPATLALGTWGTFTVTGVNTNLVQWTNVLRSVPGVTIGSVTVASPRV
jgi:hypothetical protein